MSDGTPSSVTGARGAGALADLLRPDYGAFRKRKKRPKKRRVPPRPAQYRRGY